MHPLRYADPNGCTAQVYLVRSLVSQRQPIRKRPVGPQQKQETRVTVSYQTSGTILMAANSCA
jgi:hypothetical protein